MGDFIPDGKAQPQAQASRTTDRPHPSVTTGIAKNVAAPFFVPLRCTAFDCYSEVARTACCSIRGLNLLVPTRRCSAWLRAGQWDLSNGRTASRREVDVQECRRPRTQDKPPCRTQKSQRQTRPPAWRRLLALSDDLNRRGKKERWVPVYKNVAA